MYSVNNVRSMNGHAGEEIAATLLRSQGFDVYYNPNHRDDQPDIVVAGHITVEVKTSILRRVNDHCRGYAFCIHRVNVSLPISEDFVMLVCHTPTQNRAFIIPRKSIAKCHSITIPNPDPCRYAGRWMRYLDLYELISERLA